MNTPDPNITNELLHWSLYAQQMTPAITLARAYLYADPGEPNSFPQDSADLHNACSCSTAYPR